MVNGVISASGMKISLANSAVHTGVGEFMTRIIHRNETTKKTIGRTISPLYVQPFRCDQRHRARK
eukprot:2279636-Pleurochrysis_carterae.AAC.3